MKSLLAHGGPLARAQGVKSPSVLRYVHEHYDLKMEARPVSAATAEQRQQKSFTMVHSRDQEYAEEEQGNVKRQRIEEDEKKEEEELQSMLEANANYNMAPVSVPPQQEQEESLHDLIEQNEWDRVVAKVQELRRQAQEEEKIPELHAERECIPDTKGFTPLQCALEAEADAHVISALVDAYTIKDRHDFFKHPLFRACLYIRDPACLEKMLYFAPEAVVEKEDDMSVFHVLLQFTPSLQLLEHMAHVWADQRNVNLSTAWTEIVSDKDDTGMLPLHYAIQEHAESDVILKLLGEYPASALVEAEDGLSPLHMAVFHGCSYPVLKALVEQSVGAISARKGPGKATPLHLLFHVDQKDKWLVENQVDECMSPSKMAWFLIQKHAVHAKENFGVKKSCKKERARALVMMKDGGNFTVVERVKELEDELNKAHTCREYQELRKLREEFETRILRCREFPKIDFDA